MTNAIVAGLLWCAALWRIPTLGRSRKQTAWTATLFLIALAMSFEQPRVAHYANQTIGINGIASLIEHVAGILSACCVLEFVIAVVQPKRTAGGRVRAAGAVVTVVVLTVSFLLSPRPVPDVMPFKQVEGLWPSVHAIAFELALAVAMAACAWLFLGAVRDAGGRWLRNGLLLLGIGTSVAVAYAFQKIVLVTLHLLDVQAPVSEGRQEIVAVVLRSLALFLIIVGQTLPLVPLSVRTCRQYVVWLRLRPLWRAVTLAVPHVVLRRSRVLSVERWLHRRVVEIFDGQLVLREWVTEADVPTGLPPARAEAAWLRTAIDRKAAGIPAPAGKRPELGSKGLGPAADLHWLVSLSDAMKHSPSDSAALFTTAGPAA